MKDVEVSKLIQTLEEEVAILKEQNEEIISSVRATFKPFLDYNMNQHFSTGHPDSIRRAFQEAQAQLYQLLVDIESKQNVNTKTP